MTEKTTPKDEQDNKKRGSGHLGRILVVDDERSARTALAALLAEDGYQVEQVRDGYKALGMIEKRTFDIVLTDLRMPLMNGIELIEKAKEIIPDASFIVMTAYGSIEQAVDAMKIGALDFLIKPLNFEAVQHVVSRTMKTKHMERELNELRKHKREPSEELRQGKFPGLIGNSSSLKRVLDLTKQVADSKSALLIYGGSGTGKEQLSKLIHDESKRAQAPYHIVHCANISEELIEAELFGKVSKSGDPDDEKIGALQLCDGGTVYVSEIEHLPPNLQVKLLHFLQSKTFLPSGAIHPSTSDVRIIASSSRPLDSCVREGTFREDLYYKINIVKIDMPPLAARRADIPVLVQKFAHKYGEENGKEIKSITPEFLEALEKHDWPGNIVELENVIERCVVLSSDNVLDVKHLPKDLGNLATNVQNLGGDVVIPGSKLSDIERYAIVHTYEATGGKTAETADILNVSQRKVQYKLREYMVDVEKS